MRFRACVVALLTVMLIIPFSGCVQVFTGQAPQSGPAATGGPADGSGGELSSPGAEWSGGGAQDPPEGDPEEVDPGGEPVNMRPGVVYFQIAGPRGLRLVREEQPIEAGTPARSAVEAMILGPWDPDYFSPWAPEAEVLGIAVKGEVITVDLSADAMLAHDASLEARRLMKQQLIYTLTEHLGENKLVMLHIDGRPAGELWQATRWTAPEGRADWMHTMLSVGMDSPAEMSHWASTVEVRGKAAVFEATLPWRVLLPDGSVVREGTAMTQEGQRWAPYRFEVTLPPGEYIIEITEDDPSGGAAGPPETDDRFVTVGEVPVG